MNKRTSERVMTALLDAVPYREVIVDSCDDVRTVKMNFGKYPETEETTECIGAVLKLDPTMTIDVYADWDEKAVFIRFE